MAELTLEALRSELAPMREELAFVRRAVVALQQDTRALRAAFNDFALTNPTAGEIQALHDDVNRVQAENADLQLRLATAERLIRELREAQSK